MNPYLRLTSFVFVFFTFLGLAQDRNNSSFHAEQGLFTLNSDPSSNKISYEIISMRDEYSKTFCNTDGLYTKQTSDFPMHYRGSNGAWYTYDKALNVSDDGVYKINKTSPALL